MTTLICNNKSDFVKQIYRSHHKSLYLYALGLCRRFEHIESLADDLTQDLYLKLMQKWPDIQYKYAKLGLPYLNKMLRNILTDWYRKETSMQNVRQTYVDGQAQTYELEEPSISDEGRPPFTAYLSTLSEQEHAVLQYRFVEELSYEQIAFRMNIPATTVGTHLHRAKQKLKVQLGSHQSDMP